MYDHKDGVTLRKIEKSDLSVLLKLKQESWWGTHKSPIINSDDQVCWYDNIPNDQLFMVAEIQPSKDIVGVAAYTNIDWVNRTLQISGSILKDHRSSWAYGGFCSGLDFAFEMLNMRRVEAEVLEYHIAAQKIEIDILGFAIEGRKRKAVYKCGQYYDSLILGLLREEWQESSRVKNHGDTCNKNFSHLFFQKLIKRKDH
jgi:RimJ/RimL family protein N-acetyltransferase